MSKRSRAYLRHQSERWKKRVKHYDITQSWMWPKPEPSAKDVGKVAAARTQWDIDPWGPEGTRAQEKRRAEREINDQMGDLT
jgi:hypothetical protein